MTQNTVQIAVDKETANYAVYESADEETVVGMYVTNEAAEQVGEFAELVVSLDGEGIEATKDKDTTNYGVYSTATGAINGMYVSHETLESEESDEGEPVAPDSIGLTLNTSDEETFNEAQGVDEEEIDGLLGDTEGEESDETEAEESDEDEVSIEDEVVGLVGDDE